jgi:amino acid adenylation domain-containing protein
MERARVSFHPSFIPFEPDAIEQSIPDRFHQQADLHADRPAVICSGGEITYRELDRESNRIANALLGHSTAPDEPVALCLGQGPAMVAAILGALKAGKVYVPLDARAPPSRLAHLLQESGAKLCVCEEACRGIAQAATVRPVVAITPEEVGRQADRRPGVRVRPDNLCYIMYTSGSTGRPKGVYQNHRNILHHTRVYTNAVGIGAGDRLLILSAFAFGRSVADLFGALLNGAAVCPFDLQEKGIDSLASCLASERITLYNSVPTVFRELTRSLGPGQRFPHLRLLRLGGELVRAADVELYRNYFAPGCTLLVTLGSTETNTVCHHFLDGHVKVAGMGVPVGYPVDGMEVLLVDGAGHSVPCGEVGQVVVGSSHLALGYWKCPELTRAAFSTATAGDGARTYRTGDRGRMLPDGCLEWQGRDDFQVKIRGYRVDPSEVEAALLRDPAVREAVVVGHEDPPGETRLVAYIVSRDGVAFVRRECHNFLKQLLPSYMVPTAFVALPALPLLPNGKVDRQALPAAGPDHRELANSFVAPHNPLEEELTRLWAEVLGLERVGVRDNFFDLGGHSLLVVRLLALIERRYGFLLPVTDLLRRPTAEEFAECIRDRLEVNGPPTRLRGRGEPGPYLFCLNYGPTLGRYLGSDQHVFALPLQEPDLRPYERIEQLAAALEKKVRSVQPEGPYYLAGYCYEGLVAIELARQLGQAGHAVAFLGLMECAPFGPRHRLTRRAVSRPPLASRLWTHLSALTRMSPRYWLGWLVGRVRTVFRLTWWRLFPDAAPVFPMHWGEKLIRSIRSYRPRWFPDRVTVFLAAERPQAELDAEAWRKQGIKRFKLVTVPGGHTSMWEKPHVAVVGEQLRVSLEEARRANSGGACSAPTVVEVDSG